MGKRLDAVRAGAAWSGAVRPGGMLMSGLVLAAAVATAQAQAPEAAGTAYVVTYIEVAPAAVADASALLQGVAAASRKEAGNQRYDVLRRIGRDNQFAILEAWSGRNAAQAHAGSDAFRQFRDKLRPLQVSFYDERPSSAIAVAPASAVAGKDAVYVITHVDVTPPNTDDCIGLLKRLAEDTRGDHAALRFEAWQQANRANHFTVTEVWTDRAAVEAHVAAAPTRAFRERLGPMSGALYDERLYRSL